MPANTKHAIVQDRQPETIGLDDALLWRYLDLPKFLHLIQTGKIHFARLKDFDDPYEGYPSIMKYLALQQGADRQKTISRRLNVVVNCWCWSELESPAMWALYGKNNNGIAVLTTYRKLVSVMPNSVFVGFVHYLDFFDPREYVDRLDEFVDNYETVESHHLRPVLYKRQEFSHEEEVRAFSTDFLLEQESDKRVAMAHNGWTLEIDPIQLIDSIYIQPKASPLLVENVELVVAKYGYRIPIMLSDLDKKPW